MKVEFTEDEELGQGEAIKQTAVPDTEMKKWLVNYVGEKKTPEKNEVTVGLIVETMAEEFPEFLMAVAEENWIRGYHQALQDVSIGEDIHQNMPTNTDGEVEQECD